MAQFNTTISQKQFDSILSSAREDKAFCDRIIQVLEKKGDERRYVLEAWIEESKENGAPTEVVDMLLLLLDDQYAKKSMEVLRPH